jgi:beta-lactamase class A
MYLHAQKRRRLNHSQLAELAARIGLKAPSIILKRLDAAAAAVTLEAERPLYPASMMKTPLALAVYALAADGLVDLQGSVETTEGNMTFTDLPSPLEPGRRATIAELIDLAITRSDNVATNMLYDVAGRERATAIVQQRFGLRSTAFYRKLSGSLPLIHDPLWDGVHMNSHPAADAAALFEQVARSKVPFAGELRRTLERQQWKNKLASGLREGDRFAHKTGDTDTVTHDGGLLETAEGAAWVVVVYTGMESNDENNAKFADFMREVRPFL